VLRILFCEAKKHAKGPAIFIDRDGVINCRRPGDYVLEWSQFVFVPGIREALKKLATLGLPLIVISNQAAVGKGLLDPADLEQITSNMYQALVADGTLLTAAYYCPHRSDENCHCRKPKPALVLSAASDFNIDLSRSIFIGDSDADEQAARAAGCASVLFASDDVLQPKTLMDVFTVRTSMDLFAVVANYLRTIEHFGSPSLCPTLKQDARST